MARLNEAPVPTESVDALKRRFIRQNRELAKNNSNQSIRIRNLEVEQSRLVTENLSLRERILELENQLDKDRNSHAIQNLGAVRDKLEAKIYELGSLVAELGTVQKPRPTREEKQSPKLSPSLIAWRHARLMDPISDEYRLPTISEGKHFPRRTLDAGELRRISIDASNDSPDLGPPPVAHFPVEDPIKFNPRTSLRAEEVDALGDGTEPVLSVNLETRRRRRESASRSEIKRIDTFSSSPENPETEEKPKDKASSIKAGAKRKLSAREDDRQNQSGESKESFSFSRRTQTQQDGDSQPDLTTKEKREKALDIARAKTRTPTERLVLGAKSVNTDPVVSPRKTIRSVSDGKSEFKKPALPIRESGRQHIRSRKTVSTPTVAKVINPVETTSLPVKEELSDIPPATPAGLSLFSPPSTNPSTVRPESKDTPPPGELHLSTALGASDDASHAGRAARRARAPVNYAEPNLISKMRRPTKEFAPAVIEKPKAAVLDLTGTESAPPQSGYVKRERSESRDDSWKTLPLATTSNDRREEPNSPLSKKTGGSQPITSGPSTQDDVDEENLMPSSSAAAMAELMATAGSNRRASRFSSVPSSTSSIAKARSALESEADRATENDGRATSGDSSSPENMFANSNILKSSQDGLSKIRASRRHSLVGQLPYTGPSSRAIEPSRLKVGKDDKGASDSESLGGNGDVATELLAGRRDRVIARRKSMMI